MQDSRKLKLLGCCLSVAFDKSFVASYPMPGWQPLIATGKRRFTKGGLTAEPGRGELHPPHSTREPQAAHRWWDSAAEMTEGGPRPRRHRDSHRELWCRKQRAGETFKKKERIALAREKKKDRQGKGKLAPLNINKFFIDEQTFDSPLNENVV